MSCVFYSVGMEEKRRRGGGRQGVRGSEIVTNVGGGKWTYGPREDLDTQTVGVGMTVQYIIPCIHQFIYLPGFLRNIDRIENVGMYWRSELSLCLLYYVYSVVVQGHSKESISKTYK